MPHGIGGHLYRAEEVRESSPSQLNEQVSANGKSFARPATVESGRWWGARLSTDWTSREMHYGIDETGDYGAYTTELSLRIKNLTLSVWSGFGTGNDYEEWDFTVAYNFELEPVFIIPGYNFRYQPGVVEHEHSESEEDEQGHEEEHAHLEEMITTSPAKIMRTVTRYPGIRITLMATKSSSCSGQRRFPM